MGRPFCYFGSSIIALFLATAASALSSPQDLNARPSPAVRRAIPVTGDPRDKSPQSTRPSTTVVIDPGHGGFDRGGIPSQRVPEKMMTLDVAQRLKTILAASGYRVIMTRDSDVFVPLPTRVAIANSYRNAIFVCIHFNSATRAGANGIETYFYSRESLPLASAVHYYVAGGAPTPNRGVRRRGYYVLRRTNVPAVLVECGFLTNPTEAQYVQSTNYRQRLAEEIAQGIRGRSSVVSSTGSHTIPGATRVATDAVPLQPFLDQTRVRDPDLSHSKRSGKRSSKSRSAKSTKKSSITASSSAKKKSTKEKSSTTATED
jgi:N-acetylmuramoyl-L-alanine amidase